MEEWLFKVAARKVILKLVTFVVSWFMSGVIQGHLTQAGVHLDPVQLQASLTALALSGFKALEDYLNLKFGWNI